MEPNATGATRPSFRRPIIVAGSASTMLGRPLISPQQAAREGFHAIDLDIRDAWHNDARPVLESAPFGRMRSIWIPRQYTGFLRDTRAEHLHTLLTIAIEHHGLRTVVVQTTGNARQRGTSLGQLARRVSSLTGVRVAMRVGADTLLAQPGSHLDLVANLRRMAEEWDLDLALDLTGEDIDAWEAEAALMRLFPRLSLVRIRPLQTEPGIGAQSSAERIGLRTITMLADQAYGGVISIAPMRTSMARGFSLGQPALDAAVETRELILSAYRRMDAYGVPRRAPKQQFG